MGIFWLNKIERTIWRSIQPKDLVKFMLQEDPQEIYTTRVERVKEKTISIQTPLVEGAFLEILPQTHVQVEIYTETFGKIRFVSRVNGQEWIQEQVILLSRPRRLTRIQLRRYYRIAAMLEVDYVVFSPMGVHVPGQSRQYTPYRGITKNISETGMLLISDRNLNRGDYIDMRIKVPPSQEEASREEIHARGRIVRSTAIEVGSRYAVAVEIGKIDIENREKLRRYIFHKGRDLYVRTK